MRQPFRDYWVRSMSEDQIADVADEWHNLALDTLGYEYFNIVEFIKKVLQKQLRRRDPLEIKFLPSDDPGPPARVSFKPLVLWVRVDIWAAARERDDPVARYILAHECGHVVLHDHDAKGFSDDPDQRIPENAQMRSAEWQADTFADHLLMPTSIVERCRNDEAVTRRCGVELARAGGRRRAVRTFWQRHGSSYLDRCDRCLGYNTLRIGPRVRCETCDQLVGATL